MEKNIFCKIKLLGVSFPWFNKNKNNNKIINSVNSLNTRTTMVSYF